MIFSLPAKWDYPPNFRQILLIANFESSFPADEGAQKVALKAANATLISANNEVQISERRPQWCDLFDGQYAEVETNCKNNGQSLFKILDESEIFIKRGRKTEWQERLKPAWEKIQSECMTVLLEFKRWFQNNCLSGRKYLNIIF